MKIYIKPNKVNQLKLKNNFTKRISNSKPVTKTLKVFFMIIEAVFLMDFGFISGNRRKIKIKKIVVFSLGTLFCAFVTMGICRLSLDTFRLSWRLKDIVQHYSFIAILLFTRNINFYQFIEKLSEIDLKIELRSEKYYLDIKIIALFLLTSVTKLVLVQATFDHYNSYLHNLTLEIPYLIMHVGADVPLIVLFFIFSSIKIRIKQLRKFLKRYLFDEKMISDNYIILYSHRVYMSLVDLTESIKRTYDYIFLISLIMNLPTILAIIYSGIKDIKSDTRNAFYTVKFFMVIHLICLKFAPAIAAGTLSSAAYQIKVLLHNKLVEEKDPEKNSMIFKFVNYIDTQSFRLRVFTVVPLDASLPMKVLDLCCTYVIVLIQLTHLY